nr:hypothetical protein XAC3610_5400012 [Xanthomonas citri pv. citri]
MRNVAWRFPSMSVLQAKIAGGLPGVSAGRVTQCSFTSLEHRLHQAAGMLLHHGSGPLHAHVRHLT